MQRLKEIRKKAKMTQKQLGTSLGIGSAAISKYELGSVSLSAETIVALCRILNTSSDYLLGITDVDPSSPAEASALKENTSYNATTNILVSLDSHIHSQENSYRLLKQHQEERLKMLYYYRTHLMETVYKLYSSGVDLSIISKSTRIPVNDVRTILKQHTKKK